MRVEYNRRTFKREPVERPGSEKKARHLAAAALAHLEKKFLAGTPLAGASLIDFAELSCFAFCSARGPELQALAARFVQGGGRTGVVSDEDRELAQCAEAAAALERRAAAHSGASELEKQLGFAAADLATHFAACLFSYEK